MFTRAVFLNMKPGCQAALARILEREVFALLQKESDFRGLVAFLGGTEALSLSLWDQRKSARADGGSAFTELTALSKVGLGPPSVEVFDISNSAFQAVEQMMGHEKAVGATPELKIFRVSDPIFQSVARTIPPLAMWGLLIPVANVCDRCPSPVTTIKKLAPQRPICPIFMITNGRSGGTRTMSPTLFGTAITLT
jgi:hypothetical protein